MASGVFRRPDLLDRFLPRRPVRMLEICRQAVERLGGLAGMPEFMERGRGGDFHVRVPVPVAGQQQGEGSPVRQPPEHFGGFAAEVVVGVRAQDILDDGQRVVADERDQLAQDAAPDLGILILEEFEEQVPLQNRVLEVADRGHPLILFPELGAFHQAPDLLDGKVVGVGEEMEVRRDRDQRRSGKGGRGRIPLDRCRGGGLPETGTLRRPASDSRASRTDSRCVTVQRPQAPAVPIASSAQQKWIFQARIAPPAIL